MAQTTLHLPIPPSVNTLWRYGRNKKTGKPIVYIDKAYKHWIVAADAVVLAQKPLTVIKGNFTIEIDFDANKRRADLDNLNKACLDYCQRIGVIENDKLCDRITARWVSGIVGCRVTILEAA